MPGIRIPPAASMTAASGGTASDRPTAWMRSPATSTSPSSMTPAAGSTVSTVAPRNTTGRPGTNWSALAIRARSRAQASGRPD